MKKIKNTFNPLLSKQMAGYSPDKFFISRQPSLSEMVKNKIEKFFFGNQEDGIKWPVILPKNFKYKGMNFIHHACRMQSFTMLRKAKEKGYDFLVKDKTGKNAVSCLLQEKESNPNLTTITSFNPINPDFFKELIESCPAVWNSKVNSFDLFKHFKDQSVLMLKYSSDKWSYSSDQYKKLIQAFMQCLIVLKENNLPIELTASQYRDIIFNSTVQGEILHEALKVTKPLKYALKLLINMITLFGDAQENKDKENNSYFTNPFNYGWNNIISNQSLSGHMLIIGTTGAGKSSFLPHAMKNAYGWNKKINQQSILDFWNKYVLSIPDIVQEFENDLTLQDELRINCWFLASDMLKNKLSSQMMNQSSDPNALKKKINKI